MNNKVFDQLLHRELNSHKYHFGHVLIIGGSPGMVGAPFLAAQGALRVGAGLVTIASTQYVVDKLEARVSEIMTYSYSNDSKKATAQLEAFILDRKVSVLVIGPGWRTDHESLTLASELIRTITQPVIVDGGALQIFSNTFDSITFQADRTIVLTPHTGEFSRILMQTVAIKSGEKLAADFAKLHNLTVVLKGHPTYVAHRGGAVYENNSGNPGLATAGTGDVLSGVIAGLLAQDIEPEVATNAAVFLHGLAGDIAAADKTQPGMIASDLINALPQALKQTGSA